MRRAGKGGTVAECSGDGAELMVDSLPEISQPRELEAGSFSRWETTLF